MSLQGPIYKIILLGQKGVGKASIALKYVRSQLDTQLTINASYLQKKVLLGSQSAKLAIWHTSGQQKYNSVVPVYYREALGAIVVYQITSMASFNKMQKWMAELEEHAPRSIVVTIVGNKADLQSARAVPTDQAEEYAKSVGAKHCLVSGKTGLGINQLFQELAQRIHIRQPICTNAGRGGADRKTKIPQQKPSKGCC